MTSLEPKLTQHWLEHKEHCEKGIELAEENLARVAMIYSGQLQLELYPTFEHDTFIDDLGSQDVPRIVRMVDLPEMGA